MFNDLDTIPLEQFGRNIQMLQAEEGIEIVALPREDYNIILNRLMRQHMQSHYDPKSHSPDQGWFVYKGITFTRMDEIHYSWRTDRQEVTDSSDFHQEDWNPDWHSGPGGVAYHVDIRG